MKIFFNFNSVETKNTQEEWAKNGGNMYQSTDILRSGTIKYVPVTSYKDQKPVLQSNDMGQ